MLYKYVLIESWTRSEQCLAALNTPVTSNQEFDFRPFMVRRIHNVHRHRRLQHNAINTQNPTQIQFILRLHLHTYTHYTHTHTELAAVATAAAAAAAALALINKKSEQKKNAESQNEIKHFL